MLGGPAFWGHTISAHYRWKVSNYKCLSFLFTLSFCMLFKRFLERGERRGKRERETPVCGCVSLGPHWRPGLQPRHLPWLGGEPETLWFTDHAHSTELHQPGLWMFFKSGYPYVCPLHFVLSLAYDSYPLALIPVPSPTRNTSSIFYGTKSHTQGYIMNLCNGEHSLVFIWTFSRAQILMMFPNSDN